MIKFSSIKILSCLVNDNIQRNNRNPPNKQNKVSTVFDVFINIATKYKLRLLILYLTIIVEFQQFFTDI